MDVEMQPTISYHAMEKAALTLQSFIEFYFPFHGLTDVDFLRHLALLTYTEATIYQIDEEYEANVGKEEFKSQHTQILFEILEKKGLLDEMIKREFANGMKYYRLEQKMCSGQPFGDEDIAQANRFKCYDFRVLHRLLYKLKNEPYDEELLDAFWIGEMLVDVEDDIRQYEDDAKRNVYNTCRMFVKLYGTQGKARLQEYKDGLMRQIEEKIATAHPEIGASFQKIWGAYREKFPVPPIPEPILE